MYVFAVMVEDRHCDTNVEVFADEDDAIAWASDQVPDDSGDTYEADINAAMADDGWVWLKYYGEDDCVRVMRRELK